VLLSYAYVQGWAREGTGWLADCELLVDSGAFTAFTKGQEIDRDAYCDFLARNAPEIAHAASLDVIGDWRATAATFDRMRARLDGAVSLVPAWHLGSPLEELHRLCREEPYVAIGGCVPYAKTPKILMRHLIQAHRVAAEHGTRLHGLGMTGGTSMRRLPWFSVDSSSWVGSHRFGELELTDRHGQLTKMQFGSPLTSTQAALVRAYGGDPSRVRAEDFNLIGRAGKVQGDLDREWSVMAAARSFMVLEGKIRDAQRREFHLYLASGNSQYTMQVIKAHALGSPFTTGTK
jgi:hypothetical protein